MTSSISVAMTTYNSELFLGAQLESILKQTRLPNELVVFDDGSHDGTWSILMEFSRIAPFETVMKQQESNVGFLRNIEQVIEHCTGNIIVLSDSDDIWTQDRIAVTEALFKEDPKVGAMFADGIIIDGSGQSTSDTLWEWTRFTPTLQRRMLTGKAFELLLKNQYVTGATMAFRSDLRPVLLPFPDSGWVHDEWIALIAASCARVTIAQSPLVRYRRHDKNTLGLPVRGLIRNTRSLIHDNILDSISHLPGKWQKVLNRLMSADLNCRREIGMLREKIRHQEFRIELPPSRFLRTGPIIRELVCGRYHRYSPGFRTAVQDLISKRTKRTAPHR